MNLFGEDLNHIVNVLRMKKDDTVLIGNKENSKTYIAQIEQINSDNVILNIIDELDESTEPNVEIDLYQGLPKFDKMELIIQKTTELGISKVIPLDMARCIVKLDEKDAKKKIERWQKIAEVAAKQSKRGKIPEVENKIKIKELENRVSEYDLFLVAYEDENDNNLKNILKELETKDNYKIGILIGPEGGISADEIEVLKKYGIYSENTLDVECIGSVCVTNYYPGMDISKMDDEELATINSEESKEVVYTDPDQIQKIIDCSEWGGAHGSWFNYSDYFDDQYGVEVRLTTPVDRYGTSSTYINFLSGKVPEFVVKDTN